MSKVRVEGLGEVPLDTEGLQDLLVRHCSVRIPVGKIHEAFLRRKPRLVFGAIGEGPTLQAFLCRSLRDVDFLRAQIGGSFTIRWHSITEKRWAIAKEILSIP